MNETASAVAGGAERARPWRPLMQASRHAVASGHYLASVAGLRTLERGGNAIDAGVATGVCLNVLLPDWTNFGGVAPIIVYLAGSGEVATISGVGRWPRRARLEYFRDELGAIPDGVQNAVVPAACDAWLTALALYGRLTLAAVLAPAIELAEEGFPVNADLAQHLAAANAALRQWPSSAAYLRPDGTPLRTGDTLRQPELAATFRALVAAERGAGGGDRSAAIMAARDRFYRGDLAQQMARFSRDQGGFVREDDLAEFSVRVEPPVKTTYRGYEVYACGPWCQGPVVPQTLNILEQFDLSPLEHNGSRHLHLLLEALKAAFADREAYYGDPDFVDVPIDELLGRGHARRWAERIRLDRATPGLPGPLEGGGGTWAPRGPAARGALGTPGAGGADTSYCCVVDADGNGFSATPSDAIRATPIVPGVGVVLSPRGTQSWLAAEHPSSLQPWKRPRLTPNPAVLVKDGKLAMVFGTPGGDVQPQAMVQLVVDVVDFGFDPQQAVEAPRVASESFPNSFYPHHYNPGVVRAEARLREDTLAELAALGHRVERWPERSEAAGALCAIQVDGPWGRLAAAADPRRLSYAVGW